MQNLELGLYMGIGILIGIATLISLPMRFLKQPLIIGNTLTRFLMGRYVIGLFDNIETLELFSELGHSKLQLRPQ